MSAPLGYLEWPRALETVSGRRPASIIASAGTGKTYVIEHLVARLALEDGVPLPRIAVVTFTEKAAGELRRRVRGILRSTLQPEIQAKPSGACLTITPEVQKRARRALAAFDEANIGTIHQLCLRTLRELGPLAGFSPLLGLDVEEPDIDAAFHSTLRARVRDPVFATLWSQLALGDRDTVAGVVRDVMKHRVRPLPSLVDIEDDLLQLQQAWEDLGRPTMEGDEHPFHDHPYVGGNKVTTELEAYLELSRRLLASLMDAVEGDSTPQSLMLSGFLPLRSQLRKGIKVLQRATNPERRGGPLCDDGERDFLERAQALIKLSLGYVSVSLAGEVAERVARKQMEEGTLGFSEMILRLRNALLEEAEYHHRPLTDALRARYDTVIVDEFQDTNDDQWQVFRRAFLDGEHGLIVVGDPKQAIYRFRGADVEAYKAAVHEVGAATASERANLDESWRSSGPLTAALNAVFGDGLFPGDDGITYDAVTAASKTSLSGNRAPVVLVAADNGGSTFRKDSLDSVIAGGIAAEISALLDAPPSFQGRKDKTLRALQAGDIAILGRGHKDLATVARALRRARISFLQYKRSGLYQTPEALDLLDVLICALDPSKIGHRRRALQTAFFPVEAAELVRLDESRTGDFFDEALFAWADLASRGDIPGLLRSLEKRTGAIRRLLVFEGERAATNMRQLLEHLFELHATTGMLAPRMVEELRRRIEQPVDESHGQDLLRQETERDVVNLMTMHAAKGLEFPVVFLAGGYRGKSWGTGDTPAVVHFEGERRLALVGSDWAAEIQDEEDAEDARLLYVAMTRAQGRVYLPWWNADEVSSQFDAAIYGRVRPVLSRLLSEESPHVELLPALPGPRATPGIPGDLSPADEARLRALKLPPPHAIDDDDSRRVVFGRRGPLMTSFTSLKKVAEEHGKEVGAAKNRIGSVRLSFPELSELVAEGPSEHTVHAIAPEAGRELKLPDEVPGEDVEPEISIPGGTRTGSAFHEAIEHLDMKALAAAGSLEAWLAEADRERERFASIGFDDDQVREALGLIYRTLTRRNPGARLGPDGKPVPVALPPFCRLEKYLHEVDVLFPIPEELHPTLAELSGAAAGDRALPFRARRGFLTGSIDFVFCHEGRTSFLDWKSSVLDDRSHPDREDYRPARVAEDVEAGYLLQLQIYAVGLLRWLRVQDAADYAERFGGIYYVYLRGSGREGASPDEGMLHLLPSFDEVLAWEEGLRSRTYVPRRSLRDPSHVEPFR